MTTEEGQSKFDLRSHLVQAALRASARGRHVLMALQVLTLLVAVTWFNTWPHNWTDARIKEVRRALAIAECLPLEFTGAPVPENEVEKRAEAVLASAAACGCVSRQAIQPQGSDASEYRKQLLTSIEAALLAGSRRPQLRKRLEDLAGFRKEIHAIPVPLTGLKIDVNGLGVFAGLGFSMLLVWLLVSMRRENDNYTMARRFPEVAAIVETDQVFSLVPRVVPSPNAVQRFAAAAMRAFRSVGGVPTIAFVFPVAIVAVTFWGDYDTRRIGQRTDPLATDVTLWIEGAALLLNGLLATLCVFEQRRVLGAVDAARAAGARAHDPRTPVATPPLTGC